MFKEEAMKLRKLASLALAGLMALSLTACGGNAATKTTSGDKESQQVTDSEKTDTTAAKSSESASNGGIAKEDLKVGFIFVGDENEGYTAAHYEGAKEMKEALGLSDDQIIIKWNVPEDETCKDAAMDLADQGCNIVFANSFGHESYVMEAAKEYPDVQFCHATGYQAASSGLSNMHNYFTSVYESRYVSGVVAGLKLNQMAEDGKINKDSMKVGYVGAYPYAEVISGYTSFFLGVRSVCPDAVMEVKYTNSWASFDLEKEAADALISDGCVLISQHADTTGAPTACEAAGIPCVGYNISMIATAPKTALTSASIDWGPYVTYAVQCVLDGKAIDTDWCQGYKDGAVSITELNKDVVAPGTEEKVKEVENAIKADTLHVFDLSTFTIKGNNMNTLKLDGKYEDYIADGYFHESEHGSAPAFDLLIDGITTIDN
jgi:basic membrane protein A